MAHSLIPPLFTDSVACFISWANIQSGMAGRALVLVSDFTTPVMQHYAFVLRDLITPPIDEVMDLECGKYFKKQKNHPRNEKA